MSYNAFHDRKGRWLRDLRLAFVPRASMTDHELAQAGVPTGSIIVEYIDLILNHQLQLAHGCLFIIKKRTFDLKCFWHSFGTA